MFTGVTNRVLNWLGVRRASPLYPLNDERTQRQREQIADILEAMAGEREWNPDLWRRFNEILYATHIDKLLAAADEALIHASSDAQGLDHEREELRAITYALRNRIRYEELEAVRQIVRTASRSMTKRN